jgi:arylformamidase
VPHAPDYARKWARWSQKLRAERHFQTHRFGRGASEVLDLFVSPGADVAHLHIHGGAWRALSREAASFTVRGLDDGRTSVAVADFALAPEAPLGQMVAEVRRAFLWLRDWAGARGLRVAVSGHSSGGHLGACLLHREWWDDVGLAADDFAGVLLASGIYDLAPVQLSARNSYLRLSDEDVARLSPLDSLPERLPPLAVVWGESELDEFRRQSRTYADATAGRALWHHAEELTGLNHFDVYDAFGDPGSPIGRLVRTLTRGAGTDAQGRQGDL